MAWNLQLIRQTFTGAPGGKGRAPRWKQGEVKELACNGVPFKSAIPRWFSTMPEECLFNNMICLFSGGGIASRSTVKHPIVILVHEHRVSQKYLFATWNELMHPERCRWFSKSWTFEPMAWRAALCHPLSKPQLLWIARRIRRNWFHETHGLWWVAERVLTALLFHWRPHLERRPLAWWWVNVRTVRLTHVIWWVRMQHSSGCFFEMSNYPSVEI